MGLNENDFATPAKIMNLRTLPHLLNFLPCLKGNLGFFVNSKSFNRNEGRVKYNCIVGVDHLKACF